MKTPREIILQNHQAAEDKLSAIRAEDLAAIAQAAAAPSPRSGRSFAQQFWREAIWPWRRVWLGLAGVWVVIIGMALTAQSVPASSGYASARSNPEVLTAMRDQRRLLAQLLAPAPPTAVAAPGKRSEERPSSTTI